MRIIADLHFHSRFSRACSPDLTLPNLEKIAAFKGVQILGTGDFTHPEWFAEIKEILEPAETGLYKVKNEHSLIRSPFPTILTQPSAILSPHRTRGEGNIEKDSLPLVGRDREGGVRFIPTVEISSIYSQGNKTRRVHTVFVMPSIESAGKFRSALEKKGANLKSDGRPIVGLSAEELAKIAFDIEPKTMVVPAHIWTPWFAMFGSMSGFDSVEECFGSVADKIFAVEMGMSSDAAMNWRVADLDRMALLASSDSHSLHRIAREGNVFEMQALNDLSYDWLYNGIKRKDPKEFLFTVKYHPEEGRYHYDGHADCNFSCRPSETKRYAGLCPKCGRKITVGVLSRVEQLADRPEGYQPKNAIPTRHLVPLEEVVADCYGMGVQSKKVQGAYEDLVKAAGGEYQTLLDCPYSELEKITEPIIVEGIRRNREERLHIEPGYDGKYGVVKIFTDEERAEFNGKKQEVLF
ncbi:MAG: endonuclease Q family protein [Patescibacteria group bacterium]|nr:endonuclease Q family protein [Patescibacteria group bacterium]